MGLIRTGCVKISIANQKKMIGKQSASIKVPQKEMQTAQLELGSSLSADQTVHKYDRANFSRLFNRASRPRYQFR